MKISFPMLNFYSMNLCLDMVEIKEHPKSEIKDLAKPIDTRPRKRLKRNKDESQNDDTNDPMGMFNN